MKTYLNFAKNIHNANANVLAWISSNLANYLAKNPENEQEIEHIIDFLCSDKAPKRLQKMSYGEANASAKKWLKALGKKKVETEKRGATKVVKQWQDGFKFVQLITKKAYEREGTLMKHCVGSYFGKDDEIYSLRDAKNMPHCTISNSSQQIKGKGNGSIHPKYVKYVVEFLEHLGVEVRDTEMENLGYCVPFFPEHCTSKLFRGKYFYGKREEVEYDDTIKIFTSFEELKKSKTKKKKGFLGNLDLEGSQIKSLPEEFEVGGNLDLRDTPIKSLPKRLKVGGYLNIRGTQIKSLPEGLKVRGNLYLRDTLIKSLPKGLEVGGGLYLEGSQIKSLPEGLKVGGCIDLRDTQIKSLPEGMKVGGEIDLRGSQIKSLPEGMKVGGCIDLRDTQIKSLPKGLEVGGSLYLAGSQIKSLPEGLKVGGHLNLEGSQIKSLPKGLEVGGRIYKDF